MNGLTTPDIEARSLLLGALTAVVVAVVMVLSIGRLTGFAELTSTLDDAQWQWLVLCAVGQIAVFAGYAGTFRRAVAFDSGPDVSSRFALRVALAGFGLTQLVAAGGAAGLAFTYWALRWIGLERRDALVRLIGLNTAVYLVFAAIAWIGAVLGLVSGEVPASMAIPWLIAVPVIVIVAAWFTAEDHIGRWTTTTERGFRQALSIGVAAAAWVRRALGMTSGRTILSHAMLYWFGDLLSLWAALQAFGVSLGPAPLIGAYATGYLAQIIPIPFLATGGVDTATTLTLTAVGVPVEVALLAVVAHRIFAFWLPIGPGLWSAAALSRQGQPTTRTSSR
ncbi:MAG: flippase-like domain-containing protein [Acidimicrobiia bacterium]|nr:flippase-like domain-containing protein [Acidimicrobiia bacterium]